MVILMSIHSKYIRRIKQKKKVYEFRRRYPLKEETLALIYEPRPVRAITLWILFGRPVIGDLDKMMELSGYLTQEEKISLIKYFEGMKEGFAIPIMEFGDINPKISLEEMKKYGIPVPQHIIYLDKYKDFLTMVCSRSERFSFLYFKSNHP